MGINVNTGDVKSEMAVFVTETRNRTEHQMREAVRKGEITIDYFLQNYKGIIA